MAGPACPGLPGHAPSSLSSPALICSPLGPGRLSHQLPWGALPSVPREPVFPQNCPSVAPTHLLPRTCFPGGCILRGPGIAPRPGCGESRAHLDSPTARAGRCPIHLPLLHQLCTVPSLWREGCPLSLRQHFWSFNTLSSQEGPWKFYRLGALPQTLVRIQLRGASRGPLKCTKLSMSSRASQMGDPLPPGEPHLACFSLWKALLLNLG